MQLDLLRPFGLTYVCTPFTKHPGGWGEAFSEACRITAELAKAGIPVFSPIAYTCCLAHFGEMDYGDSEFWLKFDKPFMDRCDAALAIKMDGWEFSDGMAHEIIEFEKAGKPVLFLDPRSFEVTR